MKKLYAIYFIGIILVLSACSNQATQEEKLESLGKEVEEVDDEEHSEGYQEFVKHFGEPPEGDIEDYERMDINIGDAFKIEDNSEVTLIDIELTNTIKPPKTDSAYMYYEVEEPDAIFLDVVVDVKNLQSSSKNSEDFVEVRVKYENQYEYNASPVIETDGGSNLTAASTRSIDPLKTRRLHYFVELPKEVTENLSDLEVIIDTETNDHYYYEFED